MTEFLELYGERLYDAFLMHIFYVVVSVAVAFVIALYLGIALSRFPKGAGIIIPILSTCQTIPGIVFIGLLFLYTGMKPITILIALSVYAIFPILKNTYVGIIGVPVQYIEAARGCGMSSFQILYRVELPLALPAIIGGLRLSTVYTVSWATLAAMIGLGGLGELIYAGVSSNNDTLILAGAIPSAFLAFAFSQLIDLLKKCLIPKAVRREQ